MYYFQIITNNQSISGCVFCFSPPLPTCNPLHPGGLVDAQVVVEDLEDVAEDEAEVLGGDGGAAHAAPAGRLVLGPPLPPVGQVVAQHGQHHLDDVGHLGVASPGLGHVVDILHQPVQARHPGTHGLDGVWDAED